MDDLMHYDLKTTEQIEEVIDDPEAWDIVEESESPDYDSSNTGLSGDRKLYVDKSDRSVADLYRMVEEKDLNLQPDYQRNFVWNEKVQSKFIESLFLKIPIPTIFLAENPDETLEVIDGQQRVTTIFAFRQAIEDDIPDSLSRIKKLTLQGLETLTEYNGKTLDALPIKVQRRFNNFTLPVIIIKKESSEDIKYDIFSRINQGSIKLNNQELLNVMYRGSFMNELNTIARENDEVDEIFGRRPILKNRFGYQEVLLRAFVVNSLVDNNWSLYKEMQDGRRPYNGRMKQSIIDYLKHYRNDSNAIQQLQKFVNIAVSNVKTVFGDKAFRLAEGETSSHHNTKINKTVAELQLVVLSRFSQQSVARYAKGIRETFVEFVRNANKEGDYLLFTQGTNNTSKVKKRYEWGRIVSNIIR